MNLQTRKLNMIEYLIGLQDEKVLKTIEATIGMALKNVNNSLNQFTDEELIERAKKSDSDYISGNFNTQEQLEIESQNW